MDNKTLCINLAKADSEEDVIKFLKSSGYWDDNLLWRYYGDNENNFATIGNQQSRPETAIVEKIVNSVDAVLMGECLRSGIKTDSHDAPQSISEALERFFHVYNGKLSNITPKERTELSELIGLIASGKKTNPCYSIIDKGEGQSPDKMPDTLLSIGRSNKLRIPFVQGKFNMGGTGVFQFCGNRNIQLIISKRHPEIAKNEDDQSSDKWGFTVIRREDPSKGVRSSSYRYLAPNQKILSFNAKSIPLAPSTYPQSFGEEFSFGTFIKLYDYQMTGLKTNILFDLYNRLSLLMPSIAIPVRFYERRKGYSGHSFETTLSGLSVRLEEDKRENLEPGFPTSSKATVMGQKLRMSIFAFKRGQTEKYAKNEGIIFSINGQTHGHISKGFFTRNSVRMGYLASSMLVIVDCSLFDGRAREDLFMNSRDRLRSGELRSQIEKQLEELLRDHSGLKELRDKRRREDIENKLEDSKPLAEVIESILKNSPTLSKLFIQGIRLSDPFKVEKGRKRDEFEGKKYPSFFKLIKEYPFHNPRNCPLNVKFRIQFHTDVENDYFDRDSDPGDFHLHMNYVEINDFSIHLWNGTATLNITLPEKVKIGEILHLQSNLYDINQVEPFKDEFFILLEEPIEKGKGKAGDRKPPSQNGFGDDTDRLSNLDLPNIIEVYKDDWLKYEFDKETATKVIDSGESGYDFFINMDNIHLLTEKKSNGKIDPKLMDARYKFGMVLIGLALIKDNEHKHKSDIENEEWTIYDKIQSLTKSISPILLPMIASLGDLKEEELVNKEEDLD